MSEYAAWLLLEKQIIGQVFGTDEYGSSYILPSTGKGLDTPQKLNYLGTQKGTGHLNQCGLLLIMALYWS